MVMAIDRLPEDLLADILRRLPPHVLAAARCVHSSWRAAIDARRLMEPPRLPLAGILINFQYHEFTELFACPPSPASSAKFHRCLPNGGCDVPVKDHCNGLLLLLGGYVVSPATRQWGVLPPRPPRRTAKELFFRHYDYIVFDPAVSPHYEVFVVPEVPCWSRGTRAAGCEWPPSPMLLHVYSSRTNRWEERSFPRQGAAFGTVAHVPWSRNQRCAVYWHGHLYVHHHFIMRISLLSGKYQVIKPPQGITMAQEVPQRRLGKSEKGVYFASIAYHRSLQVWILDESRAPIEWVLKYQTDLVLGRISADLGYNPDAHGSWIIEDVNDDSYHDRFPDYKEQAKHENKDLLATKEFYILGFHPHKEVLFLSESLQRGMAYHLSSSKFQYLGNMRPTRYNGFVEGYEFIESSFPYTPCLTVEFPMDN